MLAQCIEQILFPLGGEINIRHHVIHLHQNIGELFRVKTLVNGTDGRGLVRQLEVGQCLAQHLGFAIQNANELVDDRTFDIPPCCQHQQQSRGMGDLRRQGFHAIAAPPRNLQAGG